MKVNAPLIGNKKKHEHNLTHVVSTTADMSFVQPIMVNEVEPGASLKFSVGQCIYAQPMPKPTFGLIESKTYNVFVPIPDIWHPFESFLGHQSYHGSSTSYIPSEVPSLPLSVLTWTARSFGQYYIYGTLPGSTQTLSMLRCNPTVLDDDEFDAARLAFVNRLSSVYKWGFSSAFQASGQADNYTCALQYTFSNALDFIGACDWYEILPYEYDGTTRTAIVCGRLGTYGKNLYKILEGCGYSISSSLSLRSILPLVAYYKVWFDLFMPKRVRTWKDSNAFSLMEYCEQNGTSYLDLADASDAVKSRLSAFLTDLPQCYYTDNPDYVSAHITGKANNIASVDSVSYLAANNTSVSVGQQVEGRDAYTSSWAAMTRSGLNIIEALQRRINIRSVLGGNLKAIVKSIFGQDLQEDEKNYYIGSQSFDVQITQIMNQAETSEGYLGQYAGAGEARNRGKEFSYNNANGKASFGYLVSLLVLVPKSDYVQGNDVQTIRRHPNDFFASDYDSISLQPSAKSNIYGESDFSGKIGTTEVIDSVYDSGFGNIPWYFEYKFKKSILSGEFRLPSTRAQLLPFSLAKLLPYTSIEYNPAASISDGKLKIHRVAETLLVAGEQWRYIGKYPWYGQFNRIFYNSGNEEYFNSRSEDYYHYYDRVDDNFVVHNYIEYKKYSSALPVADSWQTDAYGDHISETLS